MLAGVIIFSIFLIVPSTVVATYGEKCATPAGREGKCVPVRSCAGALEVFENIQKYGAEKFENELLSILESKCGSLRDEPTICCANDEIQINPIVYNHLKNQNCGSFFGKRVSQGHKAGLFQFRWMALLKYEGKNPFACGGSLIDDRHVLTAAHCLHNFTNLPIAVRLGEYDLEHEVDCLKYGTRTKCLDPAQDIGIKEFIVHENYVYKDIHHDIAILRLDRPVNLNTKSIQTICLPISNELQSKVPEEYLVAGWGETEFGKRSNTLLWATVPYRPHEACNEIHRLSLSEEHICAGGRQFRDSCRGDSGGPIFNSTIYVDGVVRAVQYGIVSFGARMCGEMNVPAVYMSIPHYMQWITDHMILKDDDDDDDDKSAENVVYDFKTAGQAASALDAETSNFHNLPSENSVSNLKMKTSMLLPLLLIVSLRSLLCSSHF